MTHKGALLTVTLLLRTLLLDPLAGNANPPANVNPPVSTPQYTVTDLGAPPGTGSPEGIAINNQGVVLVRVNSEKITATYLWTAGQWTEIKNFIGLALNDQNQVISTVNFDRPLPRAQAKLWESGRIQDLGAATGRPESFAMGINIHGQVVGAAGKGSTSVPYLWKNGKARRLDLPDGCHAGIAQAINDGGLIVGSVDFPQKDASGDSWKSHAAVWKDGQVHDLGLLGGEGKSRLMAVNNQGQILGYRMKTHVEGRNDGKSFLWQDGQMTFLGTLMAIALNDSGTVVGCLSLSPHGGLRAAVWRDGQAVNLNDLIPTDAGWMLWDASGINNRGQIVGTGTHDHKLRAFVLTPIVPAGK